MGFNLGKVITGALGGIGGIAGGVGDFLGDNLADIIPFAAGVFGGGADTSKASSVSFQSVPETEQEKIARAGLLELGLNLPEVPKREIAGLPPRTEERTLARTTAKELAGPQDFLSLPEVQGIIQEVTAKGNLLANRIARGLQAGGNITSSPGRDTLGRVVGEVEKALASALAPFAAEERARRERLIPRLEALGLTEEERARGVTQAEKDATFDQQLTELSLKTGFRKGLLESILKLQPAVQPIIQGGTPSSISQLAPLIGPLLSSVLNNSGGGTSTSEKVRPFIPQGVLV